VHAHFGLADAYDQITSSVQPDISRTRNCQPDFRSDRAGRNAQVVLDAFVMPVSDDSNPVCIRFCSRETRNVPAPFRRIITKKVVRLAG
jgi:hypothetical protein